MLKKIILSKIVNFISCFYLRKPDRTEFMQTRIDNFKVLKELAVNELLFLCNSQESRYVTSINIEPTNSCNLKCVICPVSKKMQRRQGMMDMNLFNKIMRTCGRLDSVQFSQWGEPLLHPDICQMIKIVKAGKTKAFLTTNGTLIDQKLGFSLLDSGIDRITFSVDGVKEVYTAARGFSYEHIKENIINLKKNRDKYNYPTKIEVAMVVKEETKGYIPAFKNEFNSLVDRIQFTPMFIAGQRKTKCRELWRGSLTVYWDGLVTPCCADFDGNLTAGDANSDRISAIFNSFYMRKLRNAHIKRDFPEICSTCSEYSCKGVSRRFS